MAYIGEETLTAITVKPQFANGHTSSGVLKLKSVSFPAMNPATYNKDKVATIMAEMIPLVGLTWSKTYVNKQYSLVGDEE